MNLRASIGALFASTQSSTARVSVVFALSALATVLQATVIDFEATGQSVPGDCSAALTSTTSNGYVITSVHHHVCASGVEGLVSNGTYYLGNDIPDAGPDDKNVFVLMRAGGATPFSLHSIDLAEFFVPPRSPTTNVRFEGTVVGGGSELVSFTLDGIADGLGGIPDYQTFAFPNTFNNLTKVTFVSSSPFAVDNIVVDVTPVPEPATLGLLGVALGMFGVRYSRRDRIPSRPR